jgi:cysteine synthase
MDPPTYRGPSRLERTKLSRHIAQRWEWRNQAGQLKDMACRSMLLKLEQKGWICLPAFSAVFISTPKPF